MARGLSSNSGPAPDPNALRRDRDGESWITLPAEGRDGDPPEWPLSKASDRETVLWAGEWKRPQAVMWEANGQEIEVALYVRSLVTAEAKDAATNSRTLVRQQQEALGLSIPGLHRNKWRIGEARDAANAPVLEKHLGGGPSARDRFTVLPGGGE